MAKIRKFLVGLLFCIEIEEDEAKDECPVHSDNGQSSGSYYGSHYQSSGSSYNSSNNGNGTSGNNQGNGNQDSYHKHIIKNAFWEVDEDEVTLNAYDNHGIGIDLIDK